MLAQEVTRVRIDDPIARAERPSITFLTTEAGLVEDEAVKAAAVSTCHLSLCGVNSLAAPHAALSIKGEADGPGCGSVVS